MPIVFTEGNISMQTNRNLDQVNSWNISADFPYQLNLNGYFNRFRSDTLAGSSINTGSPAFGIKTIQVFHLGSFSSELQVNYNSAHTSGIINFKSQYYADIAVRRTFLEKRATVSLAVSDVFRMHNIRDDSHLLNNDFTFEYRYDSQVFRLEFSYSSATGNENNGIVTGRRMKKIALPKVPNLNDHQRKA